MPIPYSSERVVDMIIRSLRASGVIADNVSAQTIREVANNSSDSELDALALTLNYGGVSGTDAIFAVEDFDLVIDSDDSQAGLGPYYQQFRIERGQASLPVTDPEDHLMSVGYFNFDVFSGLKGSLVTLGPTEVIAPGADHRAAIDVGYNDSAAHSQARLYGGPEAVLPAAPGFRIISRAAVEISGTPEIQFSNSGTGSMGAARTLRGGWPNTDTTPRFAIGDYKTSDQAFLFETEEDLGGVVNLNIRPEGLEWKKVFVRGSNDANFNPIQFVIGGKMDAAWGDPDNFLNPTLLVVGNAAGDLPVLVAHSQVPTFSTGGRSVFLFSTEHTNPTPAHYIFRITQAGVGVFNIDSAGDANLGAGGAYNSAGADVAEWLDTVEDGGSFEVGTVLVINSEGKLEPSSLTGDTRVVGVVSNSAGVKLGSPGDSVDLDGVKPESKALVAAVGKVPVRCRADNGSIYPGNLLISGPDGCAVRGSSSTSSAAILGKSIGTLKSGEGKVEALVSW